MYNILVYSKIKKAITEVIGSIKATRKEHLSITSYGNLDEVILGSAVFNYDIAVLHVNDPDDIQLARRIKYFNNDTIIIYLSSNEELLPHMGKGEPFECLIGKNEYLQFRETLSHALSRIEFNSHMYFSYKIGRQDFLINLYDIVYFSSELKRIKIKHKYMGEDYFYGKLDDIEKNISGMTNIFHRVHKSYLINATYIEKKSKKEILMKDGTRISITKSDNKKT